MLRAGLLEPNQEQKKSANSEAELYDAITNTMDPKLRWKPLNIEDAMVKSLSRSDPILQRATNPEVVPSARDKTSHLKARQFCNDRKSRVQEFARMIARKHPKEIAQFGIPIRIFITSLEPDFWWISPELRKLLENKQTSCSAATLAIGDRFFDWEEDSKIYERPFYIWELLRGKHIKHIVTIQTGVLEFRPDTPSALIQLKDVTAEFPKYHKYSDREEGTGQLGIKGLDYAVKAIRALGFEPNWSDSEPVGQYLKALRAGHPATLGFPEKLSGFTFRPPGARSFDALPCSQGEQHIHLHAQMYTIPYIIDAITGYLLKPLANICGEYIGLPEHVLPAEKWGEMIVGKNNWMLKCDLPDVRFYANLCTSYTYMLGLSHNSDCPFYLCCASLQSGSPPGGFPELLSRQIGLEETLRQAKTVDYLGVMTKVMARLAETEKEQHAPKTLAPLAEVSAVAIAKSKLSSPTASQEVKVTGQVEAPAVLQVGVTKSINAGFFKALGASAPKLPTEPVRDVPTLTVPQDLLPLAPGGPGGPSVR